MLLLVMSLTLAARGAEETPFEKECARLAARIGRDTARLHELFRLHWDYTMHENPEFATEVGYPGQNHRWSDLSPEAVERRKRELAAPLRVLQSIRRARLNAADQLNYDLFKRNLEEALAGTRFPSELLPLTQLNGVQLDAARILEISPRSTLRDYEDLLARLEALPTLVDQTLVWLERGLARGVTPPRITLRDVPRQVENQREPDPQKNPLLKPFAEFPSAIPESDRARLRRRAEAVLREQVIPAFARLHEFLVAKYLPGARESTAMRDLPEGRAWYAHNVRVNTTTDLTPQQIHEIGLAEVRRIRREMERVIAATGFRGDFDAFLEFLRTDSRFFYTNAEELLRGYRDICKRADPELARFFGKLPRLPYGVLPVPDYAAPSQPTAYYQPGSPQAGRPAYFFANTFALDTRPTWEMEALALHEAVPGHHLQIALAQEMENVAEFRRHGGYTAYVEGWALYAESLGTEMGFYKDPYMDFGRLVYEMWRAVRLVVDTGLHELGWSRQQAIDYFLANASKNRHDVTVEVDRYIVWPAQALAYKLGELKIKELRALAARELGGRFDLRAFHDAVLGEGALPLDVLEARMRDWIRAQKQADANGNEKR
jgi:uncharacterized protein (DUF885 family)